MPLSRERQLLALQGLRVDLVSVANLIQLEHPEAAATLRARVKGAEDWMVTLSDAQRQFVVVDDVAGVTGAPVDTLEQAAAAWDPMTARVAAFVNGSVLPLTAAEISAAWAVYDTRP